MLVGVHIEDQQSLTVANDRLASLVGHPLVKAWMNTDLTAKKNGVNRAPYVPPPTFSVPLACRWTSFGLPRLLDG